MTMMMMMMMKWSTLATRKTQLFSIQLMDDERYVQSFEKIYAMQL